MREVLVLNVQYKRCALRYCIQSALLYQSRSWTGSANYNPYRVLWALTFKSITNCWLLPNWTITFQNTKCLFCFKNNTLDFQHLPWWNFMERYCGIFKIMWRGRYQFYVLLRVRSSLAVRAPDCQCTSCNGPGFNPSIRRHSGIWGAADEAVLNTVRTKK
jgi:hypothetical protein